MIRIGLHWFLIAGVLCAGAPARAVEPPKVMRVTPKRHRIARQPLKTRPADPAVKRQAKLKTLKTLKRSYQDTLSQLASRPKKNRGTTARPEDEALADDLARKEQAASALLKPDRNAKALLSKPEVDLVEADVADDPAPAPAGFSGTTFSGTSWQTAVVSGLSQFLAERANDEVALWLADEIASTLCSDVASPLGTVNDSVSAKELLPNTCTLVKSQKSAAQLSSLLPSALRSDFEALPLNVLELEMGFSQIVSESILSVLTQLRAGAAPLPLLAGLNDADLNNACAANDPAACVLVTIGAVAGQMGGFVNPPPGSDLVQLSKELSANPLDLLSASTAFKACQTTGDTTCKNPDLVIWLQQAKANPGPVQDSLQQLVNDLVALHQLVEGWSIAPAADTAGTLARAGSLLTAVIGLGDDGFGVAESPWTSAPPPAAPVPACSTVDLCTRIDGIRNKWNVDKDLGQAAADALKGNYADAIQQVLVFVDAQGITLPPALTKYIAFAVDLSQAKNATDVKALLNTVAAPVGSWRWKRQNAFTISVTGLVGFAGGLEHPVGGPDNGGLSYHNLATLGLIGALGVDFSFRPSPDSGNTIGVFASVLDLGQLISVPIHNNKGTTNTTAVVAGEITLAEVFAPGACLRWGIFNTPFVLGAGVSYAPSLRKFDHDAGGSDQQSVWRFQAFVGVDLTLLPIYGR